MQVTGGWRAAAMVCAMALLVPPPALAQVGVGRLAGSVKDERGKPLKGATITARNKAVTAQAFTGATDAKGRFAIIGMRAGTWTISIEAPGFQPVGFDMPIQTVRGNPNINVQLTRNPDPAPPLLLGDTDPTRLQQDLDSAAALVTKGQIDPAIAAYHRVLERHPALTSVHLQLGYLFEQKADRPAALGAYRAALKADPASDAARAAIERLQPSR